MDEQQSRIDPKHQPEPSPKAGRGHDDKAPLADREKRDLPEGNGATGKPSAFPPHN